MMINVGYIVLQYTKKLSGKKEITDEDRIQALSETIKPITYISFKDKQNIVKEVIKKNVIIENNKLIYNSCNLYYDFICQILKIYFNLEITDGTYDKLSSEKILGYLLVLIDDEYNMCKSTLDSYMKDIEHGNLLLESL